MRRFAGNPYPKDWREIARQVKDEAGGRCERCRHPEGDIRGALKPCDSECRHAPDGKQRTLTVHHLDGDPGNNADWNLAVLCQKCHLEVQGRVFMPQSFMLPHSEWMVWHVKGMLAAYEAGTWPRRDVEAPRPQA